MANLLPMCSQLKPWKESPYGPARPSWAWSQPQLKLHPPHCNPPLCSMEGAGIIIWFAFSPSLYYFFLKKNPSFSLYFTLEHECDTSSHTFNRKEWKEEKLVRGPRGPVWRWLHLNPQPSGDLFLDTCGLVGLREVYRGADAPIPVRVRLLPVDDDAEPLGDVHHYHQALLWEAQGHRRPPSQVRPN